MLNAPGVGVLSLALLFHHGVSTPTIAHDASPVRPTALFSSCQLTLTQFRPCSLPCSYPSRCRPISSPVQDKGFDVHIVADGVSSRTQADRMIAIERMRSSGAFITTHEAILFELLRR